MYSTKVYDGIIWAVIPAHEAEEIFNSSNVDMYEYFEEDQTESLIEDLAHLRRVVSMWEKIDGLYIIVEVGIEEMLISDYQESVARNNDNRSFDVWLEEKICLMLQ